ncbi:TonB-dependent receptor [Mangrovibacterium marinum]|uniref:Iron complex outermembrane receptor protein n=1 Tax=Mangrovibacterium marinum TaxID=1639118 RepID=A0A2T5C590_9BACT|nr:TonB-dependent receptor [Mangrovibacterium marinum]PTN10038.1 iron complex outermembrane receptor protein [Mangrovibacterium marinum]
MPTGLLGAAMLVMTAWGPLPAQTNGRQANKAPADSIQLTEIRVQAFHYGQRLTETPGAISLIGNEEISAVPSQQIDHVLNQLPGVDMQSGSLNTNRLSIRGVGSRSPYASNKVRAYFESIPLTNGSGETTLEDLDLSLIGLVEVVKGPSSGYYGSGLGGTILIRTDDRQNSGFYTEGSLASYNRQNYRAGIRLKETSWSHAFFIDRLQADGYRENNETERSNFSYLGTFRNEDHRFKLILLQTDLKAFIPSSLDWDTFHDNPRAAAANWAAIKGYEDYQKQLAGLSVQSNWHHGLNSTISLFGQRKAQEEQRPFNFLEEDNHYQGFRAIIEKEYPLNAVLLTTSLGNESFWENYNWHTFEATDHRRILSDNKEKRSYANFFAQILLKTETLRLSGGINLNTTNYRYGDQQTNDGDQSASHRFNPVVSPRLAASYSVSPAVAFYATMSHGFSPPSLEETLLPDGERNPDIQPETGWNYELGSRGTIGTSLYYDLSVYYMKIENLLVARRTAEDAYMGINAGTSEHPGIELRLNYRWINQPTISSKFQFSGSYSPYRFKNFVDDTNDYSGNDLTGSPKERFSVALDSSWLQKLRLLIQYRYTGAIPLRDDNRIYADAWQVVHVTASYKKSWKQFELNCSASALNLLDEKYASMLLINASSFGGQQPRYYYPAMPRSFAARISLKYLFR